MSDDKRKQLNEELARLIGKIKEGDSLSFERLYELSLPRLTPYAYTLMKKEAEAQDLLQDTYIRILGSIGTLRDDSKFLQWAYTIMHNLAMRRYRRSEKEKLVDYDEDQDLFEKIAESSDEFLPGLDIEKTEVQEAVFEMIRELPVKQRVTLLAYYYDSMKIREIADMMDCQEGTVKSRLHKAREAMKQKVIAYEKQSGIKIHSIAPFIGPALERYVEENSMPPADSEALLSRLTDHIREEGIGISDPEAGSAGGGSEPLKTARKTTRHAAKPVAIGLAAIVAAGGTIAAFNVQGNVRNAEGMRTAVSDQIASAMVYDIEDTAFSESGIRKIFSGVARNTGFDGIDLNHDGRDELVMKSEYPGEDHFDILIVDGKKRDPEPNVYSIRREKADDLEMYYVPGKKVGRIYVSRDSGGKKSYSMERLFSDEPTSGYSDVITAKEFKEAVNGGDENRIPVRIDESGFRSFDDGNAMSRYTDKRFGFTVEERPVVIATMLEDRLLVRWQQEPEGGKMTGTAADIIELGMELDIKDIRDAAECNKYMTADISGSELTLTYEDYCTLTAKLDGGKLRPDTKISVKFFE